MSSTAPVYVSGTQNEGAYEEPHARTVSMRPTLGTHTGEPHRPRSAERKAPNDSSDSHSRGVLRFTRLYGGALPLYGSCRSLPRALRKRSRRASVAGL